MLRYSLRSRHIVFATSLIWTSAAIAQDSTTETAAQADASKIATFTTQEDHQNMLKQLGITRLRPGPSGDQSAPNHANYDESLANPFPGLPDVLTLNNGDEVTTEQMWWDLRRPEIVEDFEREVLGRVPDHVPDVTWEVVNTEEKTLGDTVVVEKQLNGKVDNSTCPEIEVNISMVVGVPKGAKGKVPVLMSFGFTGHEPWADEFRRRFGSRGPGGSGDEPPKNQQLVERGWGYATISPATIQADKGEGLTRGIIGLTNQGQPRDPEDWGSLRAWAWGASRGLDYLETDEHVDSSQIGIAGVSRYGKAALVTMAFDPRFAMVLVGSSGEGGASLYRRNFGEAVENLTGSGEYHWMAGNFLKYGTEESVFGSKNAGDLPVDAHQLIALCAPRLTFISYGVPEKGDSKWLDQQGSYMATIAAQPVFRLLGAGDLGRSDDYKAERMPDVNVDLLEGELAWRQHDGGHTDLPNVKHFVQWANRLLAQNNQTGATENQTVGSTAPQAGDSDAGQKSESKITHEAHPRGDENSRIAHQQLLEKAKQGKIEVYFEGDSITRRWGATDYPKLLANWNKNFHGWNAANFAWGGDNTHNILWRLQNGELDGLSPKIVVLQAGANNLPWTGPADEARVEDVVTGIKAIIQEFQKKVPDATIILTAVFPRTQNLALMPAIDKINKQLTELADGKKIRFLNINDKLADSDGKLLPGMSSDGLHLIENGCQLWADALKPIFAEILGPPAEEDQAPPPTGDPSATN